MNNYYSAAMPFECIGLARWRQDIMCQKFNAHQRYHVFIQSRENSRRRARQIESICEVLGRQCLWFKFIFCVVHLGTGAALTWLNRLKKIDEYRIVDGASDAVTRSHIRIFVHVDQSIHMQISLSHRKWLTISGRLKYTHREIDK